MSSKASPCISLGAGGPGSGAKFFWFEGCRRSRQNNAFAVFTMTFADGQHRVLSNLFVILLFVQIHGRGIKICAALNGVLMCASLYMKIAGESDAS
jgi:hypothetical protein